MTSWCAPFWFSPNHFPNSLEFNSNDPNHMLLIVAKSVLWSNTYGIPIPKWDSNSKYLAEAFDIMQILVFKPKKVVKIVIDDKDTNMHPLTINGTTVIDNLIRMQESVFKNMNVVMTYLPWCLNTYWIHS